MNVLKSIIFASVFAVIAVAGGNQVAHAATQANACKVGDQGLAMGNSGNITVSGTTATVKFRVNGTGCTTPVSVASWIRVTSEGINDQKLYAHKTNTFGPGLHSMTVEVPACMYQVDLIDGANYTATDGTANYQYQNGQFVDGGLRDFKKGGTGTCEKPVTPVTPVTPTTPATPVTPAATAPVVTSVPSTGAGDILMGTTGLSTSVGLAYNLIRRKKLLS